MAVVIDIRAYKPEFGMVPVHIYPPKLLIDSIQGWDDVSEEIDLPTDVAGQLAEPAYVPPGARLHPGPASHILFDGGSTSGRGTAGYVIIDAEGSEVCRVGLQLGEGVTNNEAEALAAYRALLHYDHLW